jgi:proteasome assembly chaperone (PAC2) family protein
MNEKLYGVVGPIVGVAGLTLGLAEKRKIPAICILAETFGHPMYLGVKGSREILKVLSQKLSLKINIKDLDKEIQTLEKEILKKTEEMTGVAKKTALKKFKMLSEETSYIG